MTNENLAIHFMKNVNFSFYFNLYQDLHFLNVVNYSSFVTRQIHHLKEKLKRKIVSDVINHCWKSTSDQYWMNEKRLIR